MLKYYIKTTEALKRLRTDKDGVVSFEYVIVAACIVAAVVAAFGTGATGGYRDGADMTAIGAIVTAMIGRLTPEGALGCPNAPPFLRHAFDELDCSHSLVSGNTIVAICCNDRYRDTIDPK